MKEITLKIDGMMCSMCEAHVNDVVRKVVGDNLKKVKSSHLKNTCEIIIKNDEIDSDTLKSKIEETGYKVLDIQIKDYQKKGLFSFFKK